MPLSLRYARIIELVFAACACWGALAACRGQGYGAPEQQPPDASALGTAAEPPRVEPANRPKAGLAEPALERVRVKAQHYLGVPLHPALGARELSGRLPDGTWVSIVERSDDGSWLRVLSSDGLEGWLTSRYVPAARLEARRPDSIWTSPEACARSLPRTASRADRTTRLMTYNLHWFPDGGPGKRVGKSPTDIEWLACALAASEVDVVFLQEIKTTARARSELAHLIARLNQHTGGDFRVELDTCPIETTQHVGFLYDARRVTARDFAVYPRLNPHGVPCKDQLRPGFGAFFRFRGGLDLHLINVHLKSGERRRDYDLRQRSVEAFAGAVREARRRYDDDDLVIGGDLNTMGCRHCSPSISAEQELATLAGKLRGATVPLELVPAERTCSEYHRGVGVLLDHFVVSRGLRGANSLRSSVAGFCGDRECRSFTDTAKPLAAQRLSDHCPVVLDLRDIDDDP